MNDQLQYLIGLAQQRVHDQEREQEIKLAREETAQREKANRRFQQAVESCLGSDVLQAVGPVKFEQGRLRPAMRFQAGDRSFELQNLAESPHTVQLAELNDERGFTQSIASPQFDLRQPNAHDTFLDSLGKKLKEPKPY